MPAIRLMQPTDVEDVLRIQAECYVPHMNESEAIIYQRLAASPDTAWVAGQAGHLTAYLVAYRSQLGKVTPLGGDFVIPCTADCLYLHDLAVARCARGNGTSVALIRHARELATRSGLENLALVSVQDSRPFWEKQGYRAMDTLSPEQCACLAGYNTPGWYMTCRITA